MALGKNIITESREQSAQGNIPAALLSFQQMCINIDWVSERERDEAGARMRAKKHRVIVWILICINNNDYTVNREVNFNELFSGSSLPGSTNRRKYNRPAQMFVASMIYGV